MPKKEEIPESKRAQIVALMLHTKQTHASIAKNLGISRPTVTKVINRFKKTGSYSVGRHTGRRRKTTKRDDSVICRQASVDPFVTAPQIRRNLDFALLDVSTRTIQRRLREKYGPARKPSKKPLLTAVMRQKRLQFCYKYRHWTAMDWRRVMFSDESTFQMLNSTNAVVRRLPGASPSNPRYTVKTMKHPLSIMVWGCFSYKQRGALTFLPVGHRLNATGYVEILQEKLPQFMNICETQIFQHDKAPCHMARKVTDWMTLNGIQVLEWPGNSPDLNPIENLWQFVKRRLGEISYTNTSDFKEAIEKAWCLEIPSEYCHKLIDSMPRRIASIIQNSGYPTKY